MKKLVLVLLAMLVSICIYAQSSTLRKKHLNQTNQVAIEGYDPVAYFTQRRAVKGVKTISHTALGVTYYFSSQENKKLFIRNRDKYEPQYGGWCASAMSSNGQKVKVDPTNFKIIDSKLYLFCDTSYKNSLSSWKKDEKAVILKGDKNWNNQYK